MRIVCCRAQPALFGLQELMERKPGCEVQLAAAWWTPCEGCVQRVLQHELSNMRDGGCTLHPAYIAAVQTQRPAQKCALPEFRCSEFHTGCRKGARAKQVCFISDNTSLCLLYPGAPTNVCRGAACNLFVIGLSRLCTLHCCAGQGEVCTGAL